MARRIGTHDEDWEALGKDIIEKIREVSQHRPVDMVAAIGSFVFHKMNDDTYTEEFRAHIRSKISLTQPIGFVRALHYVKENVMLCVDLDPLSERLTTKKRVLMIIGIIDWFWVTYNLRRPAQEERGSLTSEASYTAQAKDLIIERIRAETVAAVAKAKAEAKAKPKSKAKAKPKSAPLRIEITPESVRAIMDDTSIDDETRAQRLGSLLNNPDHPATSDEKSMILLEFARNHMKEPDDLQKVVSIMNMVYMTSEPGTMGGELLTFLPELAQRLNEISTGLLVDIESFVAQVGLSLTDQRDALARMIMVIGVSVWFFDKHLRGKVPDITSGDSKTSNHQLHKVVLEMMLDGVESVTVQQVSAEEFAEEVRRVQAEQADNEAAEEDDDEAPPPTSGFTPFSGTSHRLPPR